VAEREHEWTLEAIFQLGGGVQVTVASSAPLGAREWRNLVRMLQLTQEFAEQDERLEREQLAKKLAKEDRSGG
jgi:hypothetical protein